MFDDLKKALDKTGIPFAETAWETAPATDYGTIALDGPGESVWADDRISEQAIQGTVDLYTHGPGRTQMKKVQAALDGEGVSWRINSIQYEEETGLMHYEWVFELEDI